MVRFDEAKAWVEIGRLGSTGSSMPTGDVRTIIAALPVAFRQLLVQNGFDATRAKALTTKFRDAGRRSAPWRVFSKRVAGRPQDGADGNRINRWLLPEDHKFYANERDATLVEIKYYLQTLSMTGAPVVSNAQFRSAFTWLVGHDVEPGLYEDPITLEPIDFQSFLDEPRTVTSGHIFPLDRGGRHVPDNTFLQLKKINDLQGNNTVDELLLLIDAIVRRHKERGTFPSTK
jgi:hypothetical protein